MSRHGDNRSPLSVHFWLDRAWLMLLSVSLRAMDLCLLALRPRLLVAYLWLRCRDALSDPWTAPVDGEAGEEYETVAFTYGETSLAVGVWLLWRAGVRRGSVVWDLGAGRGVPLLAARWLGAEAHGVELLASHVAAACGPLAWAGAQIAQGKAESAWPRGASHVLAAWLCFDSWVRDAIEQRVAAIAPRPVLITVGLPPTATRNCSLRRMQLPFSWGFEEVWVCAPGRPTTERCDAEPST